MEFLDYSDLQKNYILVIKDQAISLAKELLERYGKRITSPVTLSRPVTQSNYSLTKRVATPPPLTHTFSGGDDDNNVNDSVNDNVKGIIILRPPSPLKWIPPKPMPIEEKDPNISYDRLFNINYPIQNEPDFDDEELGQKPPDNIKSFMDIAEDFAVEEEKNDVLDDNRDIKKKISIPKSEMKEEEEDNDKNDNNEEDKHVTVADNFKLAEDDGVKEIQPQVDEENKENDNENPEDKPVETKEEEEKDDEGNKGVKKKVKKKDGVEEEDDEEEEPKPPKSKTCQLL